MLCIIDFCTKTDVCDKIKYYRLSKNTQRERERERERDREREREQKNRPTSYREYWPKTARINWDKDGIDQKEFPYNSEEL